MRPPSTITLLLAIGLGAPAAAGPGAQAPAEEETVEPRSFAIPETRYARALWERAEDHLAAERWRQAFAALQELIEEHAGELLAGRTRDEEGRTSYSSIHPGAADSARARLQGLPPEAQELYRDRYGDDAARAQAEARAVGDRRALIEVARRWPLTEAAESAWWAVGDIELELGNPDGAAAAWLRARDLRASRGLKLSGGALERTRMASELVAEGGGPLAGLAADEAPGGSLGQLTAAPRSTTVPSAECHSWRAEIDLDGHCPFNGTRNRADLFNLFPVVAGDTILVSTTLRLLAIDAFSGTVRWASDEPPGWEEVDAGRVTEPGGTKSMPREHFWAGLDRETLIVAPAAGSGVAVAPLQIPVTHTGNRDFQQITITTVIPDRRLFAFDLETGEPLWNHMPPPLWDGESGSFAERMFVAGPPVVSGSRVVVPTYRMRGRVEYHAACYDLRSGALLWSRALISGQRELNMFGRHEWEFTAPPLVVVGSNVVALTQLGAVAALDLYTGDVLWETLYDQIPLPPTRHFMADRRTKFWQNAPPIVIEGMVVATPLDGRDLMGIDLESGAMRWSIDYGELFTGRTRGRERVALLGADEHTVYLTGTRIYPCRMPAGLRSSKPPILGEDSEALYQGSAAKHGRMPRGALTERYILIPTDAGRVVFDRGDLTRMDPVLSAKWREGQSGGNALLANGALFTLTGKFLTGFFEWEEAERRFRQQVLAQPGEPEPAVQYGTFLSHRARDRRRSGRPLEALRYLEEARGILEPLVEDADAHHPDAAGRLHEVLRLEARVLTDLADARKALQRLEHARRLAPDTVALRDTLLDELDLLRGRDRRGWLERLDLLEERCAELPMPDDEEGPFPLERGLEAAGAGVAELLEEMDVGLWVLLQRVDTHAAQREVGDELEALHTILADHGDLPLPHAEGRRASERIGELLDRGAAFEYERFEASARNRLEVALAARDAELLERVALLYPHSESAREANEARLDLAYRDGDVGVAASVTLAEIPEPWNPRAASPREVQLLLRLGAALAEAGNPDYRSGLVRSLARHHPLEISEIESDAGGTLAELAEHAMLAERRAPTPEPSAFDASMRNAARVPGRHLLLGTIDLPASDGPESGSERVALFAREDGIACYRASRPRGASWVHPMDRDFRPIGSIWQVLQPERALVATREFVIAVDPRDGQQLWQWSPNDDVIESLESHGGLALVSVSGRRPSLIALDLATGLEVWSREIPEGLWPRPVCGDHRLVLLPHDDSVPIPALVLDLYTGRPQAEIALGSKVQAQNVRWAWIEHGNLVLPYFRNYRDPQQRYVAAFDLDTGGEAWRVTASDDRELDSILRHGEATYLLLLGGRENDPGGLLELRTQLGSVRPVQGVRIAAQDVPMGVTKHQVTELTDPWLFLYAPRPSERGALVRAVHLPYGERWVHRVPGAPDGSYNSKMPLPALSQSTVVLAYTEAPVDETRGKAPTNLLFLDRSTGVKRDTRVLDPDLGRAQDLDLIGLGAALLVRGRTRLDVLEAK